MSTLFSYIYLIYTWQWISKDNGTLRYNVDPLIERHFINIAQSMNEINEELVTNEQMSFKNNKQ